MNNIAIGNQSVKITSEGRYTVGEKEVTLPDLDYESVIVITPDEGKKMLDDGFREYVREKMCNITVINADSFQAGRKYENALVMNFANAHNPGGGFKLGANAQEEALCRCSTLYASITSKKASEMYIYNNTHISRVESDYMLISPNVCVFRDEKYDLLENPVVMGVITLPAPNRYGAALLADDELIEETFVRRIRIMLAAAVKYGYKNLVLGAWGCGAFGNLPEDVAACFRRVLVDEGLCSFFDEVVFAIHGGENSRNFVAFQNAFSSLPETQKAVGIMR